MNEVDKGQIQLLSRERLEPFLKIAGNLMPVAIDLHHQSLRLSAASMPVMALIEISLRNAICQQLRDRLGVPDWREWPHWKDKQRNDIKKAIDSVQRTADAKLNRKQKKTLKARIDSHTETPQKISPVGVGKTVAQLSFSFWKALLSKEYETRLWKPILRQLFPNKEIERADVAEHLHIIHRARNRIAHHEPIFRQLDALLDSIDFIAKHLTPPRQRTCPPGGDDPPIPGRHGRRTRCHTTINRQYPERIAITKAKRNHQDPAHRAGGIPQPSKRQLALKSRNTSGIPADAWRRGRR